jgi:hypothetical protein
MAFKKTSAATTATTSTAAAVAERNEPIGIALGQFESVLSMQFDEDMDITYGMLPVDLQQSVTKLLTKFNVASKGDDATVFKFNAERQQLQSGIVLAHGEGIVIKLGSYEFMVDAATDITAAPYSFNFSSDHGGTFVLDRGGVTLEVRVFFDSAYSAAIKTSDFGARMMAATTAGDLSEYLARGERLHKWADEPETTSYTVHSVSPVMDREDDQKVAYAILLAEDANGQPIRLYAPGQYSDYSGIELPAVANKTGYAFTIAGKELTISSGGKYGKLHELEIGKEYKVLSFEGGVNKFNNWQSTLTLAEGLKINGNSPINKLLQGTPEEAISSDKPATLIVDDVRTEKGKDGKVKNFVRARLLLHGAEENPMLANLRARMAATKATPIDNPL